VTTVLAAGGAIWYVTRASGVVALLLLTATTLIGVLTANRWRSERWPRFAVANLHRNLTLLALAFIATHVATIIADGYAPVGVRDVFVPFGSSYRPIWVGLGAVAVDLLLAITATSLLRKRISYRTWRALHWAAYAVWPLALFHGLGTGSDARFGWMAALSFACLTLVVIAVATRLVRSRLPRLQLSAGAVTFGLVVLLAAWYSGGPARHGWAARAGTPASLLKATPSSRVSAAASTPVARIGPFSGSLVGRMSTSGPDERGDAAVAIALAVRGDVPGVIRLTLWGSALGGSGVAMQQSAVRYENAATGTVSTGTIVGLDGTRVIADVSSASGQQMRLLMSLRLDPQAGTVDGTVNAEPAG
jgi:hypothetical protein